MTLIVRSIKNNSSSNGVSNQKITFNNNTYSIEDAIVLPQFDIRILIKLDDNGTAQETTEKGYSILAYLLTTTYKKLPGGPLKYFYSIFEKLLQNKNVGLIINDIIPINKTGYSVFYQITYLAVFPLANDGSNYNGRISSLDNYSDSIVKDSIDPNDCAGVKLLNNMLNVEALDIYAPSTVTKGNPIFYGTPNCIRAFQLMAGYFNSLNNDKDYLLNKYALITTIILKTRRFDLGKPVPDPSTTGKFLTDAQGKPYTIRTYMDWWLSDPSNQLNTDSSYYKFIKQQFSSAASTGNPGKI